MSQNNKFYTVSPDEIEALFASRVELEQLIEAKPYVPDTDSTVWPRLTAAEIDERMPRFLPQVRTFHHGSQVVTAEGEVLTGRAAFLARDKWVMFVDHNNREALRQLGRSLAWAENTQLVRELTDDKRVVLSHYRAGKVMVVSFAFEDDGHGKKRTTYPVQLGRVRYNPMTGQIAEVDSLEDYVFPFVREQAYLDYRTNANYPDELSRSLSLTVHSKHALDACLLSGGELRLWIGVPHQIDADPARRERGKVIVENLHKKVVRRAIAWYRRELQWKALPLSERTALGMVLDREAKDVEEELGDFVVDVQVPDEVLEVELAE